MTDKKRFNENLTIPNAGIVILSVYYKMLFDRLGIIKQNEFLSKEDQLKAIQYLQFLVTGQSKTDEVFLTLNKVLCGVTIDTPVMESIKISETEKELMESLINAVINHWAAIGSSSIDGFRGNWLVREGVLREQEDRWELMVEKRSYDILLNQCPFSFSIIKMPWMEKPLYVSWPY